jgi:putative DNA methylase
MTVGAALRAIADTYDQIIGSDSVEWDPITRVCASWFDEYGWSRAPYYELEKRLQPVNLSSDLLVKSGVAFAQSGEFWLRRANSLPSDWTPLNDAILTAWEITHHLVRALETLGEEAAAIILNQLSSVKNGMDLKESAKSLTLHLYQSCEKLGLASDSRSYNGLVIAWPELDRQAAAKSKSSLAPIQTTLI